STPEPTTYSPPGSTSTLSSTSTSTENPTTYSPSTEEPSSPSTSTSTTTEVPTTTEEDDDSFTFAPIDVDAAKLIIENEFRRNFVLNMTKYAWNAYVQNA